MKNVDVEIYMNQLINFFDKNPNSLKDLIGGLDKEKFYNKIRQRCLKNVEEGDEVSLTQQQLIMIVVEMKHSHSVDIDLIEIEGIFQKTKFGLISLN